MGFNLLNGVGVEIVPSRWLPTTERRQVRFPKSKRGRIRKKWAKQQKNWAEAPVHRVVILDGKVFASEATVEALRLNLDSMNFRATTGPRTEAESPPPVPSLDDVTAALADMVPWIKYGRRKRADGEEKDGR